MRQSSELWGSPTAGFSIWNWWDECVRCFHGDESAADGAREQQQQQVATLTDMIWAAGEAQRVVTANLSFLFDGDAFMSLRVSRRM
jgi:hypothetical protein